MYHLTLRSFPVIIGAVIKRSITYSECVSVTLINQHYKRTRRIIMSSAAYLALSYFYRLSHKRHDLKKKMLLSIKMCFDFL
jgi:hypothetical protein